MKHSRLRFLLGSTALLLVLLSVFATSAAPADDLIINELDADQTGADAAEFVEIYDGGAGNTSLDGFVLVFYNGASDVTYASFDLDGYSTDANGYFVAGNTGVPNLDLTFAGNFLQNGQDAVALYQANGTDFPTGTGVTTTNLIDALVYDTADADDAGLLVLLNAGQPQIDEDASSAATTQSIGRCSNGSGGQRNTSTYTTGAPTPGATNDCPIPAVVLINELDSDTPSTDVLEFVELYDGGVGSTSLAGYVLVFFNGSNDLSYASFDLDAYTTDANGYFIAGNTGLANESLTFSDNLLQNGADAVALYTANAADFPTGTAVTTTNLVDAVVYDTSDADDAGLLVLLNASQPQVDENANSAGANESIGRCPNGSGGLRDTDTYLAGDPTPGATNDCPAVGPSVVSSSPAEGATGVAVNTNPITVVFSENVLVDVDDFSLSCAGSGAQPFLASIYTAATFTVQLTLNADLPDGEVCTLTIDNDNGVDDGNNGVRNTSNQYLIGDNTIAFTTAGATCVPTLRIHDIQGNGATSPFVTQSHTVQGIVVADYQGSAKLSSFFLQEEDIDADADPATSEGIVIFDGGSPAVNVSVGDLVCVTGTVTEFTSGSGTVTELTSVTVSVISSGNALPTAASINLPVADETFLERYEGMRVTFPQALYLTDMFNLAQFGEISLSSGDRLYTPTQIVEPGAPAVVQQAANNLNRILIDDGSNTQYVNPTAFLPPGGTLRLGWTTTNLTGVLSFGFSSYRVQPDTNYPTWDSTPNPRPTDAPTVGGNVQVVSFNVLNYFNGDGMGGGFPTSRGAESLEQFQRQRAKLLSALIELDADIYSLIEIENDGFGANSAVQDIVNGLNDHYGAGVFAAADPGIGTIGTDVITLAQIYRTDVVTAVGTALVDLDDINDRPTFAQTYSVNATGGVFSVVGNHFKSKGCGDATGLDLDQGDGQSCYNARRIQQANRLLTFINGTVIPTSGDPDVLIVGDLNSYFMEDPIDVLLANGIDNLIDDPYSVSYLFQRQSGALDYAMSTASLASQVTGAEKWHINADEPPFFDYDDNFEAAYHYNPGLELGTPYWTADHDPVVVGLNVTADIVIDRTNAALVTDAAGDVTHVAEGATIGDQFCVVLPDDPAADVTVNLSIDSAFTSEIDLLNSSMVNVGDSHSIVIPGASDGTLCNANQIVGVTAVNDGAAEGQETLTDAVEVSASGYTAVYETVTVFDPGATLGAIGQIQEGASDSYTFVLTAPPGIRQVNPGGAFETVTVKITGYNARMLSVSPTTLQFTRANWNIPQTVTVTAIDDPIDRGARYNNSTAHQFSSNIAPQNSLYGGAAPNLALIRQRITVLDNDQIAGQTQSQDYYDALNLAAWLDIAPSSTPIVEGAAGVGLGVRLAGQPAEGEIVVVNLASLPGVAITPATLTFTHHNWDVYQPVMMTVASDGIEQGVYGIAVQVAITGDTTAVEFLGAVDATSIPVADVAVAMPPVAEQPAAPFVPAPEAPTTDEGSASE